MVLSAGLHDSQHDEVNVRIPELQAAGAAAKGLQVEQLGGAAGRQHLGVCCAAPLVLLFVGDNTAAEVENLLQARYTTQVSGSVQATSQQLTDLPPSMGPHATLQPDNSCSTTQHVGVRCAAPLVLVFVGDNSAAEVQNLLQAMEIAWVTAVCKTSQTHTHVLLLDWDNFAAGVEDLLQAMEVV